MCRIEERVYVGANGRRQAFEEAFLCENSRNNRLCPNVKRKTVEYLSRPPQVPREDNSSPASYNPPTPTGSSSYVLEERGPATLGRRPSSGHRKRVLLEPKIIIEIGSKKEKGQQYPKLSSRSYKRSSLGAVSIGSNDVAVESPGSDASYNLRTGFPDAPVPPTGPSAYVTRPAAPRGHSHTHSSSSCTTPSQTPSLYAASDSETPSGRTPRYQTVIHNHSSRAVPPSSSTVPENAAQMPSNPYRTTIAVPKVSTETVGADGVFPVDYSSFHSHIDFSQISPTISPVIGIRDEELVLLQKRKTVADKLRQERADHELAQAIAKDEEARQVRFELGRAEARAKERAENSYAEHEKRRAEEREEARRQRQEAQNQHKAAEARARLLRQQGLDEQAAEKARRKAQQQMNERAAKAARRDADRLEEEIAQKEREVQEAEFRLRNSRRDSRPPTRDLTKQPRRRSMSRHEVIERNRLLAEEEARMTLEREAAERREQEEQADLLRERQQRPQYWDPRGGSRIPIPNSNPGVSRRDSVSGRRESISVAAPSTVLPGVTRRNSHRVTIINPTPLSANLPSAAGSYSPRHPSARHSSYNTNNPFDHPPTLAPTAGPDNPFVSPVRDVGDTLSHEAAHKRHVHVVRPSSGDRYDHSLRRRGEDFIERTAEVYRARQASQEMGRVVGFEDDNYDDSDSKHDRIGRKKTGKGKRSV